MIKIFKNEPTSGDYRIGVGVPCHVKDLELLSKYSLPSIFRLDPSPNVIAVNINRGEGGLKKVRADLFEVVFNEYDCDILFNMSADMIVFSDALKYVHRNHIVSYGPIFKAPICTTIALFYRIYHALRRRKAWRGTYSLPREVWYEKVLAKDMWDGTDGSIRRAVDSDFECLLFPKVMIMRINPKFKQRTLYNPLLKDMNPLARVLKLLQALPF